MDLKHEKETIISVDSRDMEKLIHKTYGITEDVYDIAEDTQGHDSVEQFKIEKEPLNKWDVESLDKIKSKIGKCYYNVIEEGTYNIYVG